MLYISSCRQLKDFVKRAERSKILALDTEFIREKTYYPQLCLLQAATDKEVVIIDPLFCGKLNVLAPLLENREIVKLFHAAGQDIEILLHHTGVMPWPLFDTQVAAAFLGQAHQAGFGSVVHTFCGVRLPKCDSYTDWSRRPLSDSQIKYAADDVIYLPKLYEKMSNKLKQLGRSAWLEEDFRELADVSKYVIDPQTRYKHLKRTGKLSGPQLAAARALAAWREQAAQARDVPRKWVIGDEEIVEACRRDAITLDELFMVRGIKQHISMRDAREIVELINEALALPEEDWPEGERSPSEANVDTSIDLMVALVRLRAKENEIAMQTLASHSDLAQLARGHVEDSRVMKGWRRELIGNELMDLLNGRISLRLKKNVLKVGK